MTESVELKSREMVAAKIEIFRALDAMDWTLVDQMAWEIQTQLVERMIQPSHVERAQALIRALRAYVEVRKKQHE